MSWDKVKLADCCLSISDGDHQPPPKAVSGVPFVTIANINKSNQFDFSDTMFVPKDYYDRLDSKRKAQVGDILYSVVGSFGIPVLIKEERPFVFQRHIAILRPNERINSAFLYYTMLSRDFYAKADAAAIGAAQRTVSLTSLRGMEIELPPLKVQETIASKLSVYDNLIENNQKQIKLLEEAARRLYKEWFVNFRFPGYEDTPIVDGVPEGWEKAPIDSRISLLSGYAFKSAQFDSSGEYKIVTIKNVKDGEFDGINTNRIVSIPGKMPKHCVLTDGDILLSLTGNVGRTCIVNGNNYLLNQRVAKLQSDIPAFTYCLFRSSDMFDAMNNLANGTAQQNLSPIRTGKISILFPADNLLEEFERIVGSMISKMLSLIKQCDLLIQARDRLLPKLMSGEIEV
ncbi:restriction endonuclease subunit S [Ruminococcus bromii]|jgi:type I restriction enzyme S subunit|uniref:EcoKI restriction-modification system protein HsdS n=1 Tax=Ruminococcus bromii TaxID=40518 RepID=A0A2N0UYT9_9FIRM|nr:restriction endonuclease subunit S [Ruminococcus bromii]PKD32161.1 EcoKI restriction-modification system protein HsdS [Ruminococcus bromii]HJI84854.1 restriction endonuclease subunit S [Oscillospiraceae bacterium]